MTLASTLSINGATYADALEIWEFSKELIGARDDYVQDREDKETFSEIHAAWGQGYPSWLGIIFSTNGSDVGDWYARNDRERDPEDDDIQPPSTVLVNYDTGYAYNNNGAGCGDLHAYLMKATRDHFADRGWDFAWYNEFEGEWYTDFENMNLGDPEVGKI